MKIKEIIVVEGRDDTTKIKLAVDADTIETNGSAINKTTLAMIKHAQEKRGVIIFTDPDYPGKRIRHIIDQEVPGCKHAFLTRDEARAKHPHNKSLGIEHASAESIQQALEHVYEKTGDFHCDITKETLIAYGLLGSSHASARRNMLSRRLQIGHVNGKQLLKRLQMFQITMEQFKTVMDSIMQEETNEQ